MISSKSINFDSLNVFFAIGWSEAHLQEFETVYNAYADRVTMHVMSITHTNAQNIVPCIPPTLYKDVAEDLDHLYPNYSDDAKLIMWATVCAELSKFGVSQYRQKMNEIELNKQMQQAKGVAPVFANFNAHLN